MDLGRTSRALGLVLALAVGSMLFVVGSAGASVTLCVPSGEGAAITTPTKGSCGAGTSVVLPSAKGEQEKLLSILPHMSYSAAGVGGKPTVQFSGVNVQVINGSGSESVLNGVGNLVVGYDEKPGTQTGSHNLLLGGSGNSFSSYGGIVNGFSNKISSAYASVLGGGHNGASGFGSVISGGAFNTTKSNYSSIGGGCSNIAGSGVPSINALCTNTSHMGAFASVTGGAGNIASGIGSFIAAGESNEAGGFASFTAGGFQNRATGEGAGIVGGQEDVAVGVASAAVAGQRNQAADSYSSILAGCDNLTGAGASAIGACAGGEGILGGTAITSTIPDATAGFISDGVNSGQAGDFEISLGLAAGQCADVPYGVPGAKVGDLATIAYETNPPAGLLINTTGVTVAGQVEVEACNVSASTIHFDNVPIRVQTFR